MDSHLNSLTMEEMYITLVSNNRSNDSNTVASFITRLPKRMEFDRDWMIGLSEVTFTKSWFNVKEDSPIVLIDSSGEAYGYGKLKAGFYETEKDLQFAIEQILKKIVDIAPRLSYEKLPRIEFDIHSRRCTILPGVSPKNLNMYLYLSEELNNLLGLHFHDPKPEGHNENFIKEGNDSVRAYDLSGGIHNIYVYSNLVDSVFVGDRYTSVLRTLSVPNVPFSTVCWIPFNPIQYHKLNTNSVSSIEIAFYDDSGEKIPFEFGRSTVTLHLKKEWKGIGN